VPAHDLERELQVAIRLAREAGTSILGYYGSALAVEYKPGEEPVTAADYAADALIVDGLRAAFPGDGLMTEESDDDLSRLERERVWIVDPLDGTKDFVAETGDFVVQIALAVRGDPWLGVVYRPLGDLLYYAARGGGAYQEQDGCCRRIRVSGEADPSQMCIVASRLNYPEFVEQARQLLGIESVRRMGSVGLKVGLLARGECDLYLATTLCREWDVCAPHALLLEAGGMLTDLHGHPIVYNKPEIVECHGLVGSNGLAHQEVLAAVAPLLEQDWG
jgi:3'(2'), 5'-bisphosphate nucleotidase